MEKCHWCEKFLSDKTKQATVKNPDVFYCPECYKKGLEMEYEAMGLYDDKNY
jgi:hypothetical protein